MLNEGKEYSIELYPTREQVIATFKGFMGNNYLFENEQGRVLVDIRWAMRHRRNGVITYPRHCSDTIKLKKLEKVSTE